MTAADSNPQPDVAHSPDSEKIDRIAAYVDDQRRGADSWIAHWGKFSAYLAVAAFFFGVGTFSEIREFLSPPEPTSEEKYTQQVNKSCYGRIRPNLSDDTFVPELSNAAPHNQQVLKYRLEMFVAFNTPVPGDLPQKSRASLESALVYYGSANSFLRAAIESAKAGDNHAYMVDIGLYRQSSAAFSQAAGEAGIPLCRFYWGTAITWR
ncbi:hypothetical protein [Streptomyces sp. NBC_01285]|uniref:hypothetical protein n=1 Tax=Streptomyces sp. NBC_01285 TaxID=2903813 RepID=UPI0022522222|nr:hypothetical protein [Streptomyces sp. NBC_01285]MCX4774831.1 hypothetical protein [Streptomyces sp. NBC_01285]